MLHPAMRPTLRCSLRATCILAFGTAFTAPPSQGLPVRPITEQMAAHVLLLLLAWLWNYKPF
ncbi:hypothetical protein L0F63_003709 [Massospora cicadina]|nr:hypothetical protein L0F63_003709 [Massospora cicadina]